MAFDEEGALNVGVSGLSRSRPSMARSAVVVGQVSWSLSEHQVAAMELLFHLGDKKLGDVFMRIFGSPVVGQFEGGTRILRVIHGRDARATFETDPLPDQHSA